MKSPGSGHNHHKNYKPSKQEISMRYLVTGGAGFIGSHLVERLLKEGNYVIALDNLFSGKMSNISHLLANPNLKFYQKKSINQDLDELFKKEKPEIVFHLAAIPRVQFSIGHPKETYTANVEGTINLLRASKKHNVKRFVFSSSSSIYGNRESLPLSETMQPNPLSPYALHKLIGEYYCKLFYNLYGLETISLRYFNVYGPRQDPDGDYACLIPRFIKKIASNETPIINGSGEQTRDFTFVSDVIEANIKASQTSDKRAFGEAFNIGSSRNISVNEVTQSILKLANSSIKPAHNPPVIEPKHTLADISRAKLILGWQPKYDFIQGLKETYDSILKN